MESKIATTKTHFLVHLSIHTLEQYMRSGISYVANTFINGSDSFVALSLYLDQIVLLVDALIKFLCLKRYNSTYPEYFYGYQREAGCAKPLLSALVLSGYPYLKAKLDKRYTQLKINKDYTEYTRLQKVFHHIFPLLHLITEGIDLVFKFRYLLNKKSEYYNLLFYVLKAKLVYKSAIEENPSAIMELVNKPFILILFLAYKILNWWYSSASRNTTSTTTNTSISPPFHPQSVSRSKKCPLCSKAITHPAVLSSSGYVFCYTCISNYVRDNKKCPMTSVQAQMTNIHVIY